MPYCPKCGNQIDESMTFCPKCGASLKEQQPTTTPTAIPTAPHYGRHEKTEKNEKREKNEKGENRYIGWLIGGIAVVIIGIISYLGATGFHLVESEYEGPVTVIVIGVLLVCVAVWFSIKAKKRNPRVS